MPPKDPPESLSTLLGVCMGTEEGAGRWDGAGGVSASAAGVGAVFCTEGSSPPAVEGTARGAGATGD